LDVTSEDSIEPDALETLLAHACRRARDEAGLETEAGERAAQGDAMNLRWTGSFARLAVG
jgi:hypothetical protein